MKTILEKKLNLKHYKVNLNVLSGFLSSIGAISFWDKYNKPLKIYFFKILVTLKSCNFNQSIQYFLQAKWSGWKNNTQKIQNILMGPLMCKVQKCVLKFLKWGLPS